MDDESKALLRQIAESNRQIAENTKPPGKVRRVFDWAALVVSVAGILAIIEQIVRFFRE